MKQNQKPSQKPVHIIHPNQKMISCFCLLLTEKLNVHLSQQIQENSSHYLENPLSSFFYPIIVRLHAGLKINVSPSFLWSHEGQKNVF